MTWWVPGCCVHRKRSFDSVQKASHQPSLRRYNNIHIEIYDNDKIPSVFGWIGPKPHTAANRLRWMFRKERRNRSATKRSRAGSDPSHISFARAKYIYIYIYICVCNQRYGFLEEYFKVWGSASNENPHKRGVCGCNTQLRDVNKYRSLVSCCPQWLA